MLGACDGGGFAFNRERIRIEASTDAQTGFQQSDILVASAEQAFNTVGNRDAGYHLGWNGPP